MLSLCRWAKLTVTMPKDTVSCATKPMSFRWSQPLWLWTTKPWITWHWLWKCGWIMMQIRQECTFVCVCMSFDNDISCSAPPWYVNILTGSRQCSIKKEAEVPSRHVQQRCTYLLCTCCCKNISKCKSSCCTMRYDFAGPPAYRYIWLDANAAWQLSPF